MTMKWYLKRNALMAALSHRNLSGLTMRVERDRAGRYRPQFINPPANIRPTLAEYGYEVVDVA